MSSVIEDIIVVHVALEELKKYRIITYSSVRTDRIRKHYPATALKRLLCQL